MLSIKNFKELKKYSEYSSFAVWSSWEDVSDVSMINENNLPLFNNKYVFVALNPALRPESNNIKPFSNFHSDYSHQKDFKLCYALKGSKYYGAYMTDLFKSFHLTDSLMLSKELKNRQEDAEKDKKTLINEISILGNDVTIIALGRATEKYLRKMFDDKYKIVYARHYSYYSSKENYRDKLLTMLKEQKA